LKFHTDAYGGCTNLGKKSCPYFWHLWSRPRTFQTTQVDWGFEVLILYECLHHVHERTVILHKDGNQPTYTASYSRRPKFSYWYFIKI